MKKNNNPWRGLASYEDPACKEELSYKFCGRDEEALQLVRQIDNSLFVTLYGRTGVGKTSLLKAGVFPVLRLHNYVPLYIRLSQVAHDMSYAELIIEEIEKSENLISKRINEEKLINTNGNSITFLWDYFCQTKFYCKEGEEVYPVIVLDQFEELFISQEVGLKKKSEILMKQIHVLLNDDYVLLDHDNFSDETNYRFVASIREDNLYLLEDCIDEHSLSSFKENRFRLRPMNEEQAKNAILIPGKRCISDKCKEELASYVITAAKDNDGTISSLMLSFICSQLYEKAAQITSTPFIDTKSFTGHQTESRKLLTAFYLQHTSSAQRNIIEEYYITEDGHRKSSHIELPHSNDLVEKYHIMQNAKTEKGDGLEIVHDRLAEVIYMHRRRRDSQKFRYILGFVFFVCLMALSGLAINLSWTSTISVGKPSILALNKKPKAIYSVDTLLNEKILSIDLKYNDKIKTIIIGDRVDSIINFSTSDKQNIIISDGNENIKSDYIFKFTSFNTDSILYLYYKDKPNVAIFTQKDLNNSDSVRLPCGIDTLQYYNYRWHTLINAPNALHYGESKAVINNERELKITRGDKRLKSIIVKNIDKIPSGQFEGCVSLETVDMSSEEIELNNNCFKSCVNLKEVIFPKKVNNSPYSYGEFENCFNLRKVTLPDVVENPQNIIKMFRWCPNISEIYFSRYSHFHEAENGIIYYDSIPVIFNKCKTNNWIADDSIVRVIDAIVVNDGSQANILPNFWNEDHFSIISKTADGIKATGYIIYQKQPSNTIDLPLISGGKYTYANYNPNLREVHTQIADPSVFEFLHPYMEDMSSVTLFVPYGCRDVYIDSGKFNEFKKIEQESLGKRVIQTLHYWWAGIVWTFGTLTWLLYPIVFLLLILLAFVFYKLKVYQMSKRGIVSREKATLYALLADLSAVIGFVPVYYTIYWIAINHYKFDYVQICILMGIVLLLFAYFVTRLIIDTRKKMLWPWLLIVVVLLGLGCIYYVFKWENDLYFYNYQCIALSSFYGGISGYMCAYLSAFAGNGKILNKLKRWRISS